jgi:hypothetical protein
MNSVVSLNTVPSLLVMAFTADVRDIVDVPISPEAEV